jgi:hypothetical protein
MGDKHYDRSISALPPEFTTDVVASLEPDDALPLMSVVASRYVISPINSLFVRCNMAMSRPNFRYKEAIPFSHLPAFYRVTL